MKRRYENRIKYRAWCRDIKARYGTVTDYIYQQRLRWTPAQTSSEFTSPDLASPQLVFPVNNSTPFADPDDYKILWNDWPYGSLEPGVKHVVVWLKTPLAVDPQTGILSAEHRDLVEDFVESKFTNRLKEEGFSDARDKVRWFKNGFDLQSVRALEHIHVLVKDVPRATLFDWTHEKEPIV